MGFFYYYIFWVNGYNVVGQFAVNLKRNKKNNVFFLKEENEKERKKERKKEGKKNKNAND